MGDWVRFGGRGKEGVERIKKKEKEVKKKYKDPSIGAIDKTSNDGNVHNESGKVVFQS